MMILYCLDPLHDGRPDNDYVAEAAAAERQGAAWRLVDHDALIRGNAERAVRRVPPLATAEIGVYRGWMMTATHYESFHRALEARGVRLVNDPAAYRRCHYFPEWYGLLEGCTPRSVWIPVVGEVDMDTIMELLRPFDGRPVILKDYVKSQKHAWEEACFIPSASDRTAVERVVRCFLELQGPDLAGGLVFREFVTLESIGRHLKSGMPLALEYRLFFLDGRLLLAAEYWEDGDYDGDGPPTEWFISLASRVRSRFFTMDVAKRAGGDWVVVELGDGQAAGMPERADPEAFYQGLVQSLSRAR
jgi:hypothetical protein